MSSISSVSSSSSSSYLYEIQNEKTKQKKQNWDDLSSALTSGDLEAAKTALAAIQNGMPQTSSTSSDSSSGQSSDSGGKLGEDFKALSDALNSGDLEAAKTAFTTLKEDMKSQRAQGGQRPPPPPSGSESDSESSTTSDFETELLKSLTNSTDTSSTDLSTLIAYLSNDNANSSSSSGTTVNIQA